MQKKRIIWIIGSFLCVTLCLLFCFFKPNKIIGTIKGADMERIIIDNVPYVISDSPYSIKDKGKYIGKAAWENGEAVLRLYRIKGDPSFDYLYAFFSWEGQIYRREDLIHE